MTSVQTDSLCRHHHVYVDRGHFAALKLLTCKMVGDPLRLLNGKQGVRKQNSFSAW